MLGFGLSVAAVGQTEQHPYSTAARPRHTLEQAKGAAALLGKVKNTKGQLLSGARVVLTAAEGNGVQSQSGADGIFRVLDVPPGKYQITVQMAGFEKLTQKEVVLNPDEALMIVVTLHPTGTDPDAAARATPEMPATAPVAAQPVNGDYRELTRRPVEDIRETLFSPEVFPDDRVMSPEPDRWDTTMPTWPRWPASRS
jgi:hypothetical protein